MLQATPIQRTIQPTYLIELESAGEILQPGERIPPLKTGFYTYLITDRGEILLSLKYDVQRYIETGKGLATHKSLLRMYEERKLTSPADQVVAAGEFQVAFGTVIDFSNKSGNFRANGKRLRAAVELMKKRGLQVDTDTRVHSIDPTRLEDRGHTPLDRDFDEYHLEVKEALERSPHGKQLRDLFERFHALICDSFPQESCRASVAKMLEYRRNGARQTNDNQSAASFYYPIVTAYSKDGLDFGVLTLIRGDIVSEFNVKEEKYSIGIPLQINNVLIGAKDVLNPELKERWIELAQAFSRE